MASPYVEIRVGDRVVKVTNPDKVYFPARQETKLDLVNYYVSVGEGILRALYERPTTLERWPGGVFEGAKLSTRMDNRGDAMEFLRRHPVPYPSFSDPDASVARVFGGGSAWPTTAFYDARGRLAKTHFGAYATQAKLDEDIRDHALR